MDKQIYFSLLIVLVCNCASIQAACDLEIRNSQKVSQQLADEWPLRPLFDSKTRYVQDIADSLNSSLESHLQASQFEYPVGKWIIQLVRSLSINAYSIGNGKIYLTEGTVNFTNNEAEIAAIIAHEMAHQLLGHFCQNDANKNQFRIGSLVQVISISKEIEADALAVNILNQTDYPANTMLDIVRRLPIEDKFISQRVNRIDVLEQRLLKINLLTNPSSLKIKKD